jgi:actin-related protein
MAQTAASTASASLPQPSPPPQPQQPPQAGGGGRLPAVVIEQGAYSTQVGLAGEPSPLRTMFTAVGRTSNRKYVGDTIATCQDPSQLQFQRPFDRGYAMNWDVIQELWDRALGPEVLGIDTATLGERSLLVTEPLFNHEPLQDTMDELVFELYGFGEYCATSASVLSHIAYRHTQEGAEVPFVVCCVGLFSRRPCCARLGPHAANSPPTPTLPSCMQALALQLMLAVAPFLLCSFVA